MIPALVLWLSGPIRSIRYVEHGTSDQVLDLYVPAAKPFKTVVFTYCGGWHAPRSKSVDQVAEAFVAMGYGCLLISHRLGPQFKFPAQAEDGVCLDDVAHCQVWRQFVADLLGRA